MPRPEKVAAVEEIKTRLEAAEAVFLAEYRGLSVPQQQQLRNALREAGAEFKVVKMSLARLAATQLGLEGLAEDMLGPTAIAFADSDPVPAAKALKDFAGEHEVLVLKSGLMSGAVLTPEAVVKLAEIEPLDVLLSKIAGAAKAPLYKTATLLSALLRNSASAFSQLLEKKEQVAPIAPEQAEDEGPKAEAADEVEASEDSDDDSDAEDSADSPDSADSVDSPDSPDSPDSVDSPDAEADEGSEEAEGETLDDDPADEPDDSDAASESDAEADSEGEADAESEAATETETETDTDGAPEHDSDSDDKTETE